ncbi:hypothetical protein PVAND_009047 [Polypedilum vanderplanki]|uniref:Ionotropic receptor n=1 Tax=Polypedilum vanderplanki TaxID=319348 RepID=A0A9J6CBP7_POLVA|nr:hypothetical protein PVAND_009047 [Polypedilum vanderplanki]
MAITFERIEIRYSKKRRKKDNKNFGLNVFKITFACLIVFLALFVEISCEYVKYKALKDTLDVEPTEPISKSIADVIDEFYIKNNIDFDFIIYGNRTNHINDVINGIKETFPTTLKHIPDIEKWDHKLSRSAIFFMNSLTELEILHNHSFYTSFGTQFRNLEIKKFKFLIYIEETKSFETVENITQSIRHLAIGMLSDMSYYEFLIFNDENKIVLAANVFYSENKCREINLRKLNKFYKNTQKWDENLDNFDHYANFHGCMVNFRIPTFYEYFIEGVKSFSVLNESLSEKNIKFVGVINALLETVAKKHNFTIHYTLKDNNKVWRSKNYNLTDQNSFGIEINTNPVFYGFNYIYNSQPIDSYDFYFLISYNDFYTNYEKLIFPFDTTTWILIFFTFTLTFGSILGLHFCPHWIKLIVFGEGINNPAYNALGIFFGISQLRLPNESFCRAIFIIYLWYCLIIRTCWQSMMFEFMTTDMRKPLPQLIEHFLSMNYTMVWDIITTGYMYSETFTDANRPKDLMLYNNFEEYFSLYEAALNFDTKSKYAFFVNTHIHAILNSTFKNSLPVMKNERITKQSTISMIERTFITQLIDDTINKLMPSGILQHENDYSMWYMHRPVDVEVKDPRRILSMFDLEFGFVIFLGFLGLSIVVFICELHALYLKRQLRNLLGLYEFIRVIREKLKDYHDRW